MNLKCTVRYEGTGFAGWQTQPGERTVQGVLEEGLAVIAQRPVRIHGAGRTDAGVHALAQVFSCQWPRADLEVDRVRRSLSRMLGPAIRVEAIERVDEAFHARKSAVSKRYAYTLHVGREPDPFACRYAWTVPPGVDLEKAAEQLRRIEGTHDFAGFQGSKSSVTDTARTIHSARLLEGGVIGPRDAGGLYRIELHGDGFLYKMARNVVGAVVDIARGRLPASALDERLAAPAPYLGHTAPAHGLTLLAVLYE